MIRHDWFLSFRNNAKHLQTLRPDIYQAGQNALIAYLLEHCPPIVAEFANVPGEAVGWVCRSLVEPITHYVYVKHAYRRTGIATALVAGTKQHSHQTRAGALLFQKLGSLYNPFILNPGVPHVH